MGDDIIHSLKQVFDKELNKSIPDVLNKYVSLVCEYYDFIGEKPIIHNKQFPYLRIRGLDTITHVFFMILFYTKNLELTYYHSQKSFYLYVEFIEQILDVQHSFLHLTPVDASIFVYKKTIYEISQEYRKEYENLDETYDKIHTFIQIYKQIPQAHLKNIHTELMKHKFSKPALENIFTFVYNCDDNSPTYETDFISEISKNVC